MTAGVKAKSSHVQAVRDIFLFNTPIKTFNKKDLEYHLKALQHALKCGVFRPYDFLDRGVTLTCNGARFHIQYALSWACQSYALSKSATSK